MKHFIVYPNIIKCLPLNLQIRPLHGMSHCHQEAPHWNRTDSDYHQAPVAPIVYLMDGLMEEKPFQPTP